PDLDAPVPALCHAGQYGMQHVQRANEVDGNQLVPLGRDSLHKGLEHVPPCVVDQDFDGTQGSFDCSHGLIDLGPAGDVAFEGLGDATLTVNFISHFLRSFEIHIKDGDLCPVFGESTTCSAADASTAACRSEEHTSELQSRE